MTASAYSGVFLSMGVIQLAITAFAITMILTVKNEFARNFMGFSIRTGSLPLFCTMVAHGVVSMIFAILGALPNLPEYPSESTCYWTYKFATISYAFVVLTFFSFLYLKCQATNMQGEISKHWIDKFIHLLLLGFPFISTTIFLIANHGSLHYHTGDAFDGSTGGYCLLKTENWVVILLIIFDCGMNVVFTYMFYRPLAEVIEGSKHIKNQDESHIRRRLVLRQILKETLLTSLSGMLFNFLAVLTLYMNEVYKLGDNYSYSWMQWLPAFVPLVNSFIMLFAVRRGYEKVLGGSHNNNSHGSNKAVTAEVKPRRTSSSLSPNSPSDPEVGQRKLVDGFTKTSAA